jgi:hypothetical protein
MTCVRAARRRFRELLDEPIDLAEENAITPAI